MVVLNACGGSTASVVTVSAQPVGATSSASTGLQQSFVEVIQRVAPAVVQISTPEGLGSGVL
jgi:S1-C subfamily serine protease